MNKTDAQTELVPRLRFPEFQATGGWRPHIFGDVVQRVKTSIPVEDIALEEYVSTENLLPNFEGIGHASNLPPLSAVTQFTPGDTLFANIRPYLKKAWFATQSGGASNDVFVFRSRGRVDPRFLTQRIQSDEFVAYVMSTAKGVKMPRGDLSHIEQFPLPLPQDKVEQHKIAACLGSLDDLIAAEGRELAALRDHKKGLMQLLFPREGETRPRLRFPEFQDAPEWEEKRLEEVTSAIFDGTHQTPTYTEDGIPFYSVENLISGNTNKFISKSDYDTATKKNKPEKGDILLTRIGKIGYSQVVTWDHAFSVYVTLAVIKRSSHFNSHYLHCLMQSEFYQSELRYKSLSNATPPKINMDSLRETRVLLPGSAEQQCIADCFSALDALITAQTEKLDALRTHKRGLMQQLFPSPQGAAV